MALAAPRGLEFRQANLADPESLAVALKGRRALLNVAGPFSETGVPLIRAALSAGLSYADLNGEAPALQRLLDMDGEARRAGLTLVGGAGFGIAASDGLAAMVSEALGGADWLRISVASDSAHDSPAVAESTLAVLAGGGREIIDGEVVRRNLGRRRWRVLGADGSRQAFASAPLADLVGARHATGVVHEAVLRNFPDRSPFDIYMSGPPALIEAGRRAFVAAGLPAARLYYDSFEYAPDVLAAILRARAGIGA